MLEGTQRASDSEGHIRKRLQITIVYSLDTYFECNLVEKLKVFLTSVCTY